MRYTQPEQKTKFPLTEGNPAGEVGFDSPGIDCVHCGNPGFEHERERYRDEDTGHWAYRLHCPGGDV